MLDTIAALPSSWLSSLGGIFGLLVGSFLNVVIFRYPVMMKHQWTEQSRDWLELEPLTETAGNVLPDVVTVFAVVPKNVIANWLVGIE